ncbi:hypothetical protein GCM10010102_11920 [Promicromonospora citrea]|uniref:Uncharacterized protein n=1 Tax=Promicromonospora citrea TaxID=43677 RepID=A0A8H9GFE5_9MICO|nr:hypothetical protein GCM10010102_11920 [Promicromonospora citrea]
MHEVLGLRPDGIAVLVQQDGPLGRHVSSSVGRLAEKIASLATFKHGKHLSDYVSGAQNG